MDGEKTEKQLQLFKVTKELHQWEFEQILY